MWCVRPPDQERLDVELAWLQTVVCGVGVEPIACMCFLDGSTLKRARCSTACDGDTTSALQDGPMSKLSLQTHTGAKTDGHHKTLRSREQQKEDAEKDGKAHRPVLNRVVETIFPGEKRANEVRSAVDAGIRRYVHDVLEAGASAPRQPSQYADLDLALQAHRDKITSTAFIRMQRDSVRKAIDTLAPSELKSLGDALGKGLAPGASTILTAFHEHLTFLVKTKQLQSELRALAEQGAFSRGSHVPDHGALSKSQQLDLLRLAGLASDLQQHGSSNLPLKSALASDYGVQFSTQQLHELEVQLCSGGVAPSGAKPAPTRDAVRGSGSDHKAAHPRSPKPSDKASGSIKNRFFAVVDPHRNQQVERKARAALKAVHGDVRHWVIEVSKGNTNAAHQACALIDKACISLQPLVDGAAAVRVRGAFMCKLTAPMTLDKLKQLDQELFVALQKTPLTAEGDVLKHLAFAVKSEILHRGLVQYHQAGASLVRDLGTNFAKLSGEQQRQIPEWQKLAMVIDLQANSYVDAQTGAVSGSRYSAAQLSRVARRLERNADLVSKASPPRPAAVATPTRTATATPTPTATATPTPTPTRLSAAATAVGASDIEADMAADELKNLLQALNARDEAGASAAAEDLDAILAPTNMSGIRDEVALRRRCLEDATSAMDLSELKGLNLLLEDELSQDPDSTLSKVSEHLSASVKFELLMRGLLDLENLTPEQQTAELPALLELSRDLNDVLSHCLSTNDQQSLAQMNAELQGHVGSRPSSTGHIAAPANQRKTATDLEKAAFEASHAGQALSNILLALTADDESEAERSALMLDLVLAPEQSMVVRDAVALRRDFLVKVTSGMEPSKLLELDLLLDRGLSSAADPSLRDVTQHLSALVKFELLLRGQVEFDAQTLPSAETATRLGDLLKLVNDLQGLLAGYLSTDDLQTLQDVANDLHGRVSAPGATTVAAETVPQAVAVQQQTEWRHATVDLALPPGMPLPQALTVEEEITHATVDLALPPGMAVPQALTVEEEIEWLSEKVDLPMPTRATPTPTTTPAAMATPVATAVATPKSPQIETPLAASVAAWAAASTATQTPTRSAKNVVSEEELAVREQVRRFADALQAPEAFDLNRLQAIGAEMLRIEATPQARARFFRKAFELQEMDHLVKVSNAIEELQSSFINEQSPFGQLVFAIRIAVGVTIFLKWTDRIALDGVDLDVALDVGVPDFSKMNEAQAALLPKIRTLASAVLSKKAVEAHVLSSVEWADIENQVQRINAFSTRESYDDEDEIFRAVNSWAEGKLSR